MNRKKLIWRLTLFAMFIVSVLVFTPVVIPVNKFTPELFGLPYTLWMGLGVYIAYVLLIFIGISVHSKIFGEGEND
jgi:uncharacterized membrane protein